MRFAQLALRPISSAALGLAIASAASAQVPDTGAGADINANVGQAADAGLDANAGQNNTNPLDTSSTTDVDANLDTNQDTNRVRANANIQADGTQADADVNVNSDRTQSDLPLNGDTDPSGATRELDIDGTSQSDADLNDSRARSNTGVDARQNLNASRDAFGVTFDSSVTDRLVIQEALPNSAAARIGLQAGDRIIGFNGRTYADVNRFNADLAGFSSNSDIPIIYERNGRVYTRNIRLSGQNGYRNDRLYDGNQSHSAGRPMYGVSDSEFVDQSGAVNGEYSGQIVGGDNCCGGGNLAYPTANVYSHQDCYSHGRHHGRHHGRRGRHMRAW
jgi:hypothetical protein